MQQMKKATVQLFPQSPTIKKQTKSTENGKKVDAKYVLLQVSAAGVNFSQWRKKNVKKI